MQLIKYGLLRRLLDNVEKKRQTHIFFYYAGHGLEEVGKGVIVALNSADKKKMNYPLEKMLRYIATTPYSFVTTLLDSCREAMKPQYRSGGDEGTSTADSATGHYVVTYGTGTDGRVD